MSDQRTPSEPINQPAPTGDGSAPQAPQYQPPVYHPPQYAPGQYAPPQAPQHPQAQYAQGQYAYQPQQYAPYGYVLPSGRKFWALGFLFFIPYVGWLVSLIVSLAMNSSARRDPNPVVRENARWAANWNLTVLIAFVACGFMIFGAAIAAGVTDEVGGDGDLWLPAAIIGVLLMVAVGIAHLVVCLVGTIQADRQVFHPAVTIPFIRPIG